MKSLSIVAIGKKLMLSALLLVSMSIIHRSNAAGLTIITHGYEGDVTGWIKAMADAIPPYFHDRYGGLSTNFSLYTLTLTTDGTFLYYSWSTNSGVSPLKTDTGEIIVKLDWSQMAGSVEDPFVYDVSTYDVALVALSAILQTNAIADFAGHSVAEYPIHLIGHSRGGSLMNQLSLLLGTNGIWVDHLTTLDPYPLNNDGNHDSPINVLDASASNTYANVLFADNYYQHLANDAFDLDPRGEPVSGAYRRQLSSLSGGYINDPFDILNDPYEYHSNVHLWYYGTIDFDVPAVYDDDGYGISINATMRTNWWTSYEEEGVNAGFAYSLIGGGNRLSTDRPLGLPRDPAIVDGYNQYWNFGGATTVNRTALPANNGTWPNIIKFDVIGTNTVYQGQTIGAKFFNQNGGNGSNLTVQLYFDRDFNPYNTNGIFITQIILPNTGNSVFYDNVNLTTTNVPPGVYAIYGKISDGLHTRYLYTPELVEILPSQQPPVLGISQFNATQFVIAVSGMPGQRMGLQASREFQNWLPLATNILSTEIWNYTNTSATVGTQFYRALLLP